MAVRAHTFMLVVACVLSAACVHAAPLGNTYTATATHPQATQRQGRRRLDALDLARDDNQRRAIEMARKRANEKADDVQRVADEKRQAEDNKRRASRHHSRGGNRASPNPPPPPRPNAWESEQQLKKFLAVAMEKGAKPKPENLVGMQTKDLHKLMGWSSNRGKTNLYMARKVIQLQVAKDFIEENTRIPGVAPKRRAPSPQAHTLPNGKPDADFTMRNLQSIVTRLIKLAELGGKLKVAHPQPDPAKVSETVMGLDQVMKESEFLDKQTKDKLGGERMRAKQALQDMTNKMVEMINRATRSNDMDEMEKMLLHCTQCGDERLKSSRKRLKLTLDVVRKNPRRQRNHRRDEVRRA